MSEGNFARINDVAPETLKSTNDRTERLLLAYVRCLKCREQFVIQTCAFDKSQRCSEYDAELGVENLHTHILCKCGEQVFSGIVSFRTTKDTDEFNTKKKLTWEQKKKLFAARS